MNLKVDQFLQVADKWKVEMEFLRSIVLDCGLIEEFKWGQPCYTYNGKNVVIISSFKKYAFISFFKGALLKDVHSVLVSPGENSKSARLIPFTEISEIESIKNVVREYVFEAIEVESLGLNVKRTNVAEMKIPEELKEKFGKDPKFERAFKSLTPGRQKGYLLYFAKAKRSVTRVSRIEKYQDRIMKGKGMQDCVCGASKRMPNCDGSHKLLNSAED